MASVYSSLDGFPDKDEQPEYYEMLADIGRFADKPDSSLLVAVSEKDELLGGVVYFRTWLSTAPVERQATRRTLSGSDCL